MKKKIMVKRVISLLTVIIMVATMVSCGNNGGNIVIDESKKGALGLTTADDGTILLNGQSIYAFGVNIYDIFVNKRLNDPNYDCEAPFKALHDAGIPLARISVGPYNIAQMEKYYYSTDEYFEALDAVIAAAEKWQIGLFVSISWNSWTIPEFVGEHLSAMGNMESKTVAFAKEYYSAVVNRYKFSPAIWAWEMGNEYNLNADLVYVAGGLEYLPGQVTFTNEPRSWLDYYTSYDIQKYYGAIATEIRNIDGTRLIVGGDSEMSERPASLRKSASWQADTVEDIAETTLLYAPSPMEAVSSHMYQGGLATENDYRDFQKVLKDALTACKSVKKGYYIGEYGPGTCWNDQTATLEMYEKCVDLIHEACYDQGVQIALAWLCTTDYDGSYKSLGSTLGEYWFDEIVKYNKKYKDSGKQNNIAEYWKNVTSTLNYDEIKYNCSNYLMGTGNPGCAIMMKEDGSGFIYWTGSTYGTNSSNYLLEDTLADGSKGMVFKMENRDSSAKSFLKNSEICGLSKDGSYILSFYMKTENMKGSGVSVKAGAPIFFTQDDIKCETEGQWQYFEFEIGAPTTQKENYSVAFYLTEQEGTVSFYDVTIRNK